MKINGQKVKGRNQVVIVIPRTHGQSLAFIAEAVMSMAPFDKICPMPKAPMKVRPGGVKDYDTTDKGYLAALKRREEQKSSWLFLETFKNTPGLEWELVNPNDPNTYCHIDKELADSDINFVEIQRLMGAMNEANCLSENLVESARQSFLLGTLGQAAESSGQNTEQESSPSGEPVDVPE